MSEYKSRKRVQMTIAHNEPDRVPIHDMLWFTTIKKWRTEGLPDDISVADFFGYEFTEMWADLSPRFPIKTLSEDENYITTTTSTGGIRRNRKDYSNTGQDIDSPIKGKIEWYQIKERLIADHSRVDWELARKKYKAAREKGRYVVFQAGCGYDILKLYIKNEQLLALLVDDPDWIRDMAATISELICETLKIMINQGFHFDGLWVWHDMGYKYRSFFSPETYRNVFSEADKNRNEWCHNNGMQTIIHSDGYVKNLIPDMIKNGFDCLQPIEIKSGMDLIELKRLYGDKIALFGGINMTIVENGSDADVEREVKEKLTIAKLGGGYLYHSDHSVSNRVSLRRYKFLLDCVRKYGCY